MNFQDKVVVITGGNSGIGEAIAKKFNAHKAKTVLFGRNRERLEKVAKELERVLIVEGDVTKTKDLDHLYQKTKEKFGAVDVLIANAGVGERRHIKEVNEEFFDYIVDINYKGLYFTVQRSTSYLNKGASIILISSAACHKGWKSHSVYSSTKAAVSQLARNFSADLVDEGIRVNALSPGFTETPIFDEAQKQNPNCKADYAKGVPLKRFASSEEIADAALFLSSAPYIVGIDLLVDGGASKIHPL